MESFFNFLDSTANLIIAIGVVVNTGIALYGLRKIEQVHIATNSKMDKLLAVTSESAKAQGVLQGKQEAQQRVGP